MIESLEARIAPAVLLSASQLANSTPAKGGSVVATNAQGDIIVAGTFFGTLTLDAKGPAQHVLTTTDPAGDLYIAEYQPNGTLIWATQWGGAGPEVAHGIAVDASGNIFVTGSFASTNAGFTSLGAQGAKMSPVGTEDVFLLKLNGADGTPNLTFNGTGQLRWGGNETASAPVEAGYSVAVDSTGSVIVAGTFGSPDAGFDSVQTVGTSGGQDAFVFKISAITGAPYLSFGDFGVETFGGSGYDAFFRVRVDANNNLALAYTEGDGATGTQQSDNILYLHGFDNQPNYPFGNNTGEANFIPAGMATTAPFDIAFDSSGDIIAAGVQGKLQVARFDGISGDLDPNYGVSGVFALNVTPVGGVELNLDSSDQVYVTGLLKSGAFIATIGQGGIGSDVQTAAAVTSFSSAIDPNGGLALRGTYSGNPNLGFSNDVPNLPARSPATLGANMSDGFVLRWDHNAIDARNPLHYSDPAGNSLVASMTGPGYGQIVSNGPLFFTDIGTIELFDTTLATSISVSIVNPGLSPSLILLGGQGLKPPPQLGHILTEAPNQSVGNITVGKGFLLGDQDTSLVPAIHVSGQLENLVTDDIEPSSKIILGDGLPYLDTLNNHPNLTLGDILGPNVEIDVLGDGTPGGVGGGGLGNVVIHSWAQVASPGYIRTTQSIGNFTVQQGDFYGILEVGEYPTVPGVTLVPAKLAVHATTGGGSTTNTANVGNMTVENGAWGSSGSEIAGNIESFDATAFLAGASITAASVGSIKMTSGDFAGTLILTNSGAATVGTFTVNSDFTGEVISAQALKKIKIKGDFTGSLQAPGIASITAYAFLGTAPANPGGPYLNAIIVTNGFLGLIKSTAGIIHDFQFTTPDAFAGISVSESDLLQDTVGINNVSITAASIGNISVTLKAAKAASGISLAGIENSSFTTSGTGSTKTTAGNLGNISVNLVGNAGVTDETGISNTTFDAQVLAGEFTGNPASTVNQMGKISVKASGATGDTIGIESASFAANSIKTTAVSITPGRSETSAAAINGVTYTADIAIGSISLTGDATTADATALDVWSGGTIGAVTIKTKHAGEGSLADSSILAGLALTSAGAVSTKDLVARIHAASLGPITISGSLLDSAIAAGGNLGAVTVGGMASSSTILAGAILGVDHTLSGGDASFQRAAAIAAITVKGSFASTTIAAGITPGSITGYGSGDALAPAFGTLTTTSQIGPIALGSGAALSGPPTAAHTYVIEAAALQKLTVPQAPPITTFTTPFVVDLNGNGVDDAADLLVQLLS